jgi:hypothetical protein
MASGIAELFKNVLQHLKCIQVRMEYQKVNTTQRQKHVLNSAIIKVEHAINSICGLLPDSDSALLIKKELDKSDLVYVMIFTEQLMRAQEEDLEPIASMVEDYLNKKYGEQSKD